MSKVEILNFFYESQLCELKDIGWVSEFNKDNLKNTKLRFDLVNADDGNIVATPDDKLTPRFLKKLEEDGLKRILLKDEELIGCHLAEDIINISSGEVLFEAGDLIEKDVLASVKTQKINKINVLMVDGNNIGPWILNTIQNDKNFSREEALVDIYRVMRPGEPPAYESAEALFQNLFFDEERYDLSAVGRVKMSARLILDVDDRVRTLR